MGILLGLYRDNGKEMETTIQWGIYWSYIIKHEGVSGNGGSPRFRVLGSEFRVHIRASRYGRPQIGTVWTMESYSLLAVL